MYFYSVYLNHKFIETVIFNSLLTNFEVKEKLLTLNYDSNVLVKMSEILNRKL